MRKRISLLSAVLAVAFAMAGLFATASSAALPVIYDSLAAGGYAATHQGQPPPGANDFSCKPSAAHPRPVVLAHGTFANMTINWYTLSPLLKNNGYCVFAFNFGETQYSSGNFYGMDRVANSAGQLSAFVDQVRSATGASKVDIVGHSQGGMMPRYYLKFLGGASKVGTLVGLAPSNHGTTLGGLSYLAAQYPTLPSLLLYSWCPACEDQMAGSAFNQNLDAGGDTVPGVKYTVIETQYDQVVIPYTNAFLSGSNVKNITLQNGCILNLTEHLAIAYDRRALRYVLNALDPAHAKSAPCVVTLPAIGG
jgi:triacylglycerol esterase/lipase EstA (alpha/beta hydrolase family)